MDLAKDFCDGERQRYFEMKQTYKVSLLKLSIKYLYFAKLPGVWFLFEKLHTLSTMKTSKNVVKSGCFSKILRWRAQVFFSK